MSDITSLLLALIPALLNFGILMYLVFFLPRSKIVNVFGLFIVALIMWQCADVASRLNLPVEEYVYWSQFFSIGWSMVGALLLHFTGIYTGRKRLNSRLFLFMIYGSFFLLYLLYNSNHSASHYEYDSFWGWTGKPREGTTDLLQRYLISAAAIISAFLIFKFALRQKRGNRKTQALIIAIGVTIPTLQGFITQGIYPQFFGEDIPLTSAFLTFFSIATIWAFKKYNLFSVLDSLVLDLLLENISLIVMVISPSGKLVYKNNFADRKLTATGTAKVSEINELFVLDTGYGQDFKTKVFEPSLQGEIINSYESRFDINGGKSIDVLISAEPILNNNIIQGVLIIATDITEKKLAEIRIRNAKERYEAVVKSTSDAIWIHHFDRDRTYIVGSGHKKLFGYDIEEDFAEPNYWESKLHPEDAARAKQDKKDALEMAGNEQVYSEYRFKRADGEYIYVLDRFSTIHEEGKPVMIIGAMQDINERKQNEKLLLLEKAIYEYNSNSDVPLSSVLDELCIQTEKLFRQVFCVIFTGQESAKYIAGPSLPDELWVLLNEPSFARALNSDETEKIIYDLGINLNGTDNSLDSGIIDSCYSIAVKRSNGEAQGRFITFFTRNKVVGTTEKNILDRVATAVSVVLENRLALEEIKLAKNRYDIVAKATSDTIWDFNLKEDTIQYNNGMFLQFGYDQSKIEKTRKWWQEKIHKDDLENIKQSLYEVFKSEQSNLTLEYRFKNANGHYRYILDRAYIIYNHKRKPIRIIGAMQDITERHEHLEAIEKQYKRLREIAYLQSHMVRGPVARILGLAEIIRQIDSNDEEIPELLGYIVNSAHELDDVIREVVNKTSEIGD